MTGADPVPAPDWKGLALQQLREFRSRMGEGDDAALEALWTLSSFPGGPPPRAPDRTALWDLLNELLQRTRQLQDKLTETYAVRRGAWAEFARALRGLLDEVLASGSAEPARALGSVFAPLLFAENRLAHIRERARRVALADRTPFYCGLADAEESFILAGGRFADALPYFDLWLAREPDRRRVVAALSREVASVHDARPVDALCFVIKRHGPRGPYAVDQDLRRALPGKPSLYLNLNAGNDEPADRLFGENAPERGHVCIVYDLCRTGRALREAASELRAAGRAGPVSSVVLYRYDGADPGDVDVRPIFGQDEKEREDLVGRIRREGVRVRLPSPRRAPARGRLGKTDRQYFSDKGWFHRNFISLDRFRGLWVAVHKGRVCASGSTYDVAKTRAMLETGLEKRDICVEYVDAPTATF